MSTSFYLVRHGSKEKSVGDVPLSPQGILQAQATARYFHSLPVRTILSSPLRRAKQTAAYIALGGGLPVSEDIRLRERANWGDLTGQTFDEFVAMWERCTRDRDYMPPVGDSARRAGERLSAVLSEWAQRQPGTNMIMVTHGGLITDFLVNTFSEDRLNLWDPAFLAVQSDLVPECSITKIDYVQGKFDLENFASTRHLVNWNHVDKPQATEMD